MEGSDGRDAVLLAAPLAEQVREEGREQGREQGREEGRIEYRRTMIIRILERRGVTVPDTARERVEACTDLDRIETWAQRAVHATDASELFAAE